MVDEPKPLVFPPKPAGGASEPRPLDFSKMTSDWIRPERPNMTEPKGLNFGARPAPAPKPAKEPRALKLPTAPPPSAPQQALRDHAAPRALGLSTTPVPIQPPKAAPREAILGGDPRAPALVEAARAINPQLADHRLFRNRLEMFLDLRPAQWATWADKDLSILIGAASKQAEFSRQLSLANAVKWATDCEQAYKKPPSLMDRLKAIKPEFYQERLAQARDILIKVCDEIDHLVDDLRPRMELVSLDALVLQVSTSAVTDQSDQITATRRLQTIVGGQQTAAMILQSFEVLQTTIANQKATVSDLLTITIPNWIIARSKA